MLYFIKEKEVKAELGNTAKEQARGYFPLDIILQEPLVARATASGSLTTPFRRPCWRQGRARKFSQLQSDFIRRFIEKITSYQIHYEEIKKGTSSDVICTVFETINTTGKRLTVFDLLVARCFPSEHEFARYARGCFRYVSIKLFDPEGEGIAPIALPRIIALKEKGNRKTFRYSRIETQEMIKEHWSYAVDALEQALEFMAHRYGCFGEGLSHSIRRFLRWRSSLRRISSSIPTNICKCSINGIGVPSFRSII